jgi:hypothetical protein
MSPEHNCADAGWYRCVKSRERRRRRDYPINVECAAWKSGGNQQTSFFVAVTAFLSDTSCLGYLECHSVFNKLLASSRKREYAAVQARDVTSTIPRMIKQQCHMQ